MGITESAEKAARITKGAARYFSQPFLSAVILAGGCGSRMGMRNGTTKQFFSLSGEPMILRTIRVFENAECVKEIVVVARREEVPLYAPMLKKAGIRKLRTVVPGGETRQDSAYEGMKAVSPDCAYIAIHDGDRPLITEEQIELVASEAFREGAAAAASHAKDTVKLTNHSGYVIQTPERATVWNAATPQIFKIEAYRAAVYLGRENNRAVTDDCSLVEAVGLPVRMVDVGYRNIKITTPEDLCIAEALLALTESEKKECTQNASV